MLVRFETPRAPAGARPTALLRPRCVSASKQHVWLPPRAFLPSFRERRASRFPSTHSCGPLRSILQRETLGVHSFRAGGAAGGRRRRRTCCGLCLWPSRRRRPRLDCRWSSWRWPGHLRWPRAVPTETRGRIKAVMSLCCGSISSSFAPPQESRLQSYELRRRRASLILAEQLRGGLDALQRRRRPDACGSLLAVASRVRAIRSSA